MTLLSATALPQTDGRSGRRRGRGGIEPEMQAVQLNSGSMNAGSADLQRASALDSIFRDLGVAR